MTCVLYDTHGSVMFSMAWMVVSHVQFDVFDGMFGIWMVDTGWLSVLMFSVACLVDTGCCVTCSDVFDGMFGVFDG